MSSLSFSYSRHSQYVPPPLPPSVTGALSTADLEAIASALEQPSLLSRFVTRQLQIESSARELSRAASVVPPQREEVAPGSSSSTSTYSSSASTQVRHPAFATLRSRLVTFTNWPHTHKSNYPSATPITLALEGFFSPPDPQSRLSSHLDEVVCYACGGHLSNWEPTDVPAAEHHTHQKGRCALLRLRAASKVQPSTIAIAKGVAKKYSLRPSAASSVSSASASSGRDFSYIPSSTTALLGGVENLIGRHHYRLPSISASSSGSAEQRERDKYVKALARRYRSDHSGTGGGGDSSLGLVPDLGSSDEDADADYLGDENSEAGGDSATPPALVSPPPQVFKTHDPLYLPIPPEQIQAAVYVTPVTSSADARASGSSSVSYPDWTDPDSYASSSMRERRERALASRGDGYSSHDKSYPLSAFERLRHRHLKRSRSLWSMEQYEDGTAELKQHLPPVAPDSVYAREEASKYRRQTVDQESALKQAKEKVRELRQAGISISSSAHLALSTSSASPASAGLERDLQSHTERLRTAQRAVQALEDELRNRFASSISSSVPSSSSSSNYRRAIRLSALANSGGGSSSISSVAGTGVNASSALASGGEAEEILRERLGFAKDRMARMKRTVQAELDAQLKSLDKKESNDASSSTTLDPLALMQTIWMQEAATAVMLGQ